MIKFSIALHRPIASRALACCRTQRDDSLVGDAYLADAQSLNPTNEKVTGDPRLYWRVEPDSM